MNAWVFKDDKKKITTGLKILRHVTLLQFNKAENLPVFSLWFLSLCLSLFSRVVAVGLHAAVTGGCEVPSRESPSWLELQTGRCADRSTEPGNVQKHTLLMS